MSVSIEHTPVLSEDDALARTIARLNDIKAAIAQLEDEKTYLSEQIIKELPDTPSAVATLPDGSMVKATVVRSSTKEVNLVRLRDLDEDLFNHVTTIKLDGRSLDRALNAGRFNTPDLMATLSVKEKAPYVRLSPFNPYSDDDAA